jgi:phage tail protein X
VRETLTHTTREGDRWDTLAAECYGGAFFVGLLLEANPAYAAMPVLPAGLKLRVPVVEPDAVAEKRAKVVAWR